MRKKLFNMRNWHYILIIILNLNLCFSQSNSKYQKAISTFVNDPELANASISISVINTKNKELVVGYQENKSLCPASSLKILTCAAALEVLGPNFKISTPFVLEGKKINDTSFFGDLNIIGKGDPTFASQQMDGALNIEQIIDSVYYFLKLRNITLISGQIHVNSDYIKDIPENPEWLWYDLGNYYGAGCFGLNLMENTAWITLLGSYQNGALCNIIKVYPPCLESTFCSEVTTSLNDDGEEVFILGSSKDPNHNVIGSILCCGNDTLNLKTSISNPPATFEILLMEGLEKRGIQFQLVKHLDADHIEVLWEHKSPELIYIIERALKRSVNLYVESLVHILGDRWYGTTNRKQALLGIVNYWKNKGIIDRGIVLKDGSGLSPKNAISSYQLASTLLNISENKQFKDFCKLLPDASTEGALSKYFDPKNDNNKFRLKSGSMEFIRSWSGYIMDHNVPQYAFSAIINHYSCSSEYLRKKMASLLNDLSKI